MHPFRSSIAKSISSCMSSIETRSSPGVVMVEIKDYTTQHNKTCVVDHGFITRVPTVAKENEKMIDEV